MVAFGRAGFGPEQALASRYTTMSAPLWVAVALLASLAMRRPDQEVAFRPRLAIGAVVFSLMLLSVMAGYHGFLQAKARSQHLGPARRALMVGRSDMLMTRLYPDASVVRQRRVMLQAMRLSVFR
jgi:hypothetical protein